MSLPPRKVQASWFPHGYGVRLVAMVGALVLIGATIYSLRNRALAARGPGVNAARAHEAADPEKQSWTETVIEGPADESPIEQDEIKKYFEVVADKEGITAVDMPAYFRLLKWARSRSFAELEQRSNRDVPFAKFWNEPQKHRGELVRMRIHVQRILDWGDVQENAAGVKTIYEIWGGTDESKGNPYVVLCSELPPEIKVASETHAEVVFVGYFLKIYGYEAFSGTRRGAPMLIGRVRAIPKVNIAATRSAGLITMLAIGGAVIVAVIIVVAVYRVSRQSRRRPARVSSPDPSSEKNIESWLENIPGEGAEPAAASLPRFSTALATNGQAPHPADPETNGHAVE